ncbi:MAG: transglutaminase domain-containing protein [Cellvibrio sp.]|nr:transglutaminase domain-containing protein [Cellvibrio sp.]
MIVRHSGLRFYYSLSLAFAGSAATFAYAGFLLSLLALLVIYFVTSYSLIRIKDQEEATNTYHKLSEHLAALGIMLFLPLLFISGILPALVLLLVFALLALNFQLFDWRRLYMGFGASVAVVALGASQSKSGGYLVYLMGYVMSLSMTLGFAYMLYQSRQVNVRWPLSNRMGIASLLGASAFIIYLLTPQLPAGNLGGTPGSDHFYKNSEWESEAKNNDAVKDSSLDEALKKQRQVSEDFASDQQDSNSVATEEIPQSNQEKSPPNSSTFNGGLQQFDTTKPDPQNSRFHNGLIAYIKSDRPLYLRTAIFDYFDGVYWQKKSAGSIKLPMKYTGLTLYKVPKTDLQVNYEVEMVASIDQIIPLAAIPSQLNFPASVVAMNTEGQISSPGKILAGTSYSATSWVRQFDKRVYAEAALAEVNYLQLPKDLDARIPELAISLTQDQVSNADKAIAIEQYLRTQFTYELQSIFQSQHKTPLVPFLFETKKGHCEYFASALVILLRSLDIPARFVTGYSATQQNPLTGYYEVHALDGHAWVEAFIEGKGWMILEPTAFYDGPWFEPSVFSAEKISDYVEKQKRYRDVTEGAGEFSLEESLGFLWQQAVDAFVILLAYVKWFFVSCWIYLIAFIALFLACRQCWMLYCKPILFWWIYRSAIKQLQRSPDQTFQVCLQACFDLLLLVNRQFPAGTRIEVFLEKMHQLGLLENPQSMSHVFNEQFYNFNQQQADAYRQLLDNIYKRGYSGLSELSDK